MNIQDRKPISFEYFKIFFIVFFTLSGVLLNLYADTVYYVQSPNAKLLVNPKLDSPGVPLANGSSVRSIGESGLFIQVRYINKTGWVSKLFLSSFPPGKQIKLGASGTATLSAQNRQRPSDFTKTAAARGLSETKKLRIRGNSEKFDFDGLKWLEKVGQLDKENYTKNKEFTSTAAQSDSSIFNFFQSETPSSSKKEVKMGRSLAAKLIKKYGIIKNEEATKYVNGIGQELSTITARTDLDFRFGILNTNEINAFACPGGIIFITKGAFKKMDSESELISVLAHEISHVTLNHHGKFENDNIFLEILSSALSPSGSEIVTSATSEVISHLENEFFENGRDKKTEWEADESAVFLTSQLGYNPRSYSEYLIRISKLNQSTVLLKTHPNPTERVERLKPLYDDLDINIINNIDNKTFQRIKKSI